MLCFMAEHHSHQQDRDNGKFSKADDGRLPLDVTLPSVDPMAEIGVGGTQVFGGFLEEHEQDATLRGVAKYKVYSDCLANVAVIGAGVRLLLNLVANAEWKVQPSDDESEESIEMAEKVDKMLHGMDTPWHRIVRRLAMYRHYGFAIAEWIARRNEDGDIVMADIQPRAQITIERWLLDEHSKVLGVVQVDPQTGKNIPIPREKLIYVIDDALNDSPEGMGLFRHIVDSCRRLRRLLQLEGFGYESDLRGIPVGRAPLLELDTMVKGKKISQQTADKLLEGMEQFMRNHVKNPSLGVLLDSTPYKQTGENRTPSQILQWDIGLLDGGSYSLAEVAEAIIRIQREIARVLGVEHLLLGENASASRSISDNKTQSFGLIVDGTLKEIREQVKADILKPLWELNGWDPKLMPDLKTETQAFRSIGELTAAIRDLSAAGVQVDRQDEAVQEMMDLMGLSRLLPLSKLDTDLLLSSEDAQQQAIDIMGAKKEDNDDSEDDNGSR